MLQNPGLLQSWPAALERLEMERGCSGFWQIIRINPLYPLNLRSILAAVNKPGGLWKSPTTKSAIPLAALPSGVGPR
jgi:hypothetical protein